MQDDKYLDKFAKDDTGRLLAVDFDQWITDMVDKRDPDSDAVQPMELPPPLKDAIFVDEVLGLANISFAAEGMRSMEVEAKRR